jgi:hypothetical protein
MRWFMKRLSLRRVLSDPNEIGSVEARTETLVLEAGEAAPPDDPGVPPDEPKPLNGASPGQVNGSAKELEDSADKPDEEQEEQESFWAPFVERVRFLAMILFEIVIDGVYILLAYAWSILIYHLAGHFEEVPGYQSLLFIITKAVLALVPSAVLLWFVVIDFIGSVIRIWRERPWLVATS